MTKKKIIIAGAGFAGLATAYFASAHSEVLLLDPRGIGAGASGVAAGLLHCFAGKYAPLNWQGREALAASQQLIREVEESFGQPIAEKKGILRLARQSEQQAAFYQRAQEHPDLRWITTEECRQTVPSIAPCEGIFVKDGWMVNSGLYLQGLWQACVRRGVIFEQRALMPADQDHFVVIAAGDGSIDLCPLALRRMKGQLLRYAWPAGLPPLPFPVSESVYVVMSRDQSSCWAGSTFEKDNADPNPDMAVARALIEPKLHVLVPKLAGCAPLECQAGIRCTAPGHLPVLQQTGPRTWVFTGLGSKGLLYHALFARRLDEQLSH